MIFVPRTFVPPPETAPAKTTVADVCPCRGLRSGLRVIEFVFGVTVIRVGGVAQWLAEFVA